MPYLVNLNPGVSDAIAQVTAGGTGSLHDAPADHDVDIRKTLGTTIVQPHLTVTETATPSSGTAPLEIKYEYTVTNDSSTNAPIGNVVVKDTMCAEVTYVSGDSNNNRVIDVGERWTYTCTTTRETPATVTNRVTATGTSDIENGRPVDATPVSTTVTVTEGPGTTSQPGTPGAGPEAETGTPAGPGAPDAPESGVLGQRIASPNARSSRRPAACVSRAQEPAAARARADDGARPHRRGWDPGARRARAGHRPGHPPDQGHERERHRGVPRAGATRRAAGHPVQPLPGRRSRARAPRPPARNNQVPRGTG